MLRLARLIAAVSAAACVALPVQAASLLEVYQLAQSNDAQLKANLARSEADRETANIYKSQLLPQVTAQGQLMRGRMDLSGQDCTLQQLSTSMASGTLGGASNYSTSCAGVKLDNKTVNVTVNQALFNKAAWHDAQYGKKIAATASTQQQLEQMQLLTRTTEAYIRVLNAIDTYNTLRAEQRAVAKQYDEAQARFDAGLVAITDLQDAQAAADGVQVRVLNARTQVGLAFEALEVLTGQPIATVSPLAADFPIDALSPATTQEWEQLSLASSLALKQAQLHLEAQQEKTKARRADHLPTLTGTLQYEDYELDSTFSGANKFSEARDGYTAVLTLRIPLYSGGMVSAQRRQALLEQQAAEFDLEHARRVTLQQVRSLYLAIATDRERVSAEQRAIASAQSAVMAAEASYEVGTRNIVDVLMAKQRLYGAQLGYASARYQYVLDTVQLLQVSGSLREEHIAHFNQWLVADTQHQKADFVQ